MADVVCKFFLQGRCKYGAQCRFRHPSGAGGGGGQWNSRGGGGQWNSRGGGGQWNSRGGGGQWNSRGGGRRQGDPVDFGNRRDQRGGNHFQLFSDGGSSDYSSYGDGRRWDNQRQNQWRGGGRGGRGGGRGGWEGGNRSNNYGQSSNRRYQNDWYQRDSQRQNWSGGGRGSGGRGSFNNYQKSYNSYSNYHRDTGGYQQRGAPPDTNPLDDPREVASQIRIDMEEWSKSSMWPLSCYAYSGKVPCLPGLMDVSPDELRWEAYQAESSGNSQHYLGILSQLSDARLKKMHDYSNLTRDDVKDMMSSLSSSDTQHTGSLFAPTTTGTTVQSLFGNTTSPSSSLFGSQTTGGGSSLFQSVPPPASTSLFSQPTQSLFGDVGTTKQLSLNAGQQNAASGSSQVQHPVQTTQQITPSQPATQQPTHSHPVTAPNADTDLKLSSAEIQAFNADTFTLGQIPEHAPPDVMCN